MLNPIIIMALNKKKLVGLKFSYSTDRLKNNFPMSEIVL